MSLPFLRIASPVDGVRLYVQWVKAVNHVTTQILRAGIDKHENENWVGAVDEAHEPFSHAFPAIRLGSEAGFIHEMDMGDIQGIAENSANAQKAAEDVFSCTERIDTIFKVSQAKGQLKSITPEYGLQKSTLKVLYGGAERSPCLDIAGYLWFLDKNEDKIRDSLADSNVSERETDNMFDEIVRAAKYLSSIKMAVYLPADPIGSLNLGFQQVVAIFDPTQGGSGKLLSSKKEILDWVWSHRAE